RRQAKNQEQHARQEKQKTRAAHEHEAQVPPAVAEAAQMRPAVAAIGPKCDRNLFNLQLRQAALDHHLARQFHSRHLQVHLGDSIFAEAAHAAVRIADTGPEEEVEEPAQAWIADMLVQPGHGPGLDLAFQTVAHYQVSAASQALDEALQVGEVVAV